MAEQISQCGAQFVLTPPDTPRRPVAMPPDFRPGPHHYDLAARFGVDLEEAFATFCDHHEAKGNKFQCWSKALNTWLRRELSVRAS